MNRTILALIEHTIGTRLILSTRLQALGYRILILSSAEEFQKQIEAASYDWILLDAAVLPQLRGRFFRHLERHRGDARIAWCGDPLRRSSILWEAVFHKPLRYDDIERFFSAWTSSPAHTEEDARAAVR